ncbi:MAG: cytochrome c3 family protein [Desulfuromonadia bacterium]
MKRLVSTLVTFSITLLPVIGSGRMQQQLVFETSNGKVVFTHSDHQDAEKDCSVCHGKHEPGRIPGFGKERAHQLCIGCHQKKNGPQKCFECHEKGG